MINFFLFFSTQLTNNFNGGDSYSAPPLDSYEPGKYAPSFLKPKPQPQPQHNLLAQRPLVQPAPRPIQVPQYIPPIPMKLFRPNPPPQNFRPQQQSHAHSIAQGYSSGQSQHGNSHGIAQGHSQGFSQGHSQGFAQQGHSQGHSQFQNSQIGLLPPGPRGQQPRYPLPHRAPVPQGLFQSIGQHVQALDNGQRGINTGNTYVPPPASELPIPPMKLVVPHHQPAQPFLSQHQSTQQSHGSGSASSNSAYPYQNQELRNVHIIHDCGKGPQLNQGYSAPSQSYGGPVHSYPAPQPSGPPADSYGTPLGQPLESYQPPADSGYQSLSGNYEIPDGSLEVPQHNSIDFSSHSNSYGPPASGPASLDVLGLESQQRANTVVASESQNIISVDSNSETLPGLSSGLTGLNFISAQKSLSIDVPSQGGQVGSYQLQFTSSHSDQNNLDTPDHQQILADGLLQSIISAIDKKPTQTVPQVSEEQDIDHSDVQVFLKSPRGQEVLAEKPSQGEHSSS